VKTWPTAEELLSQAVSVAVAAGKPRYIIRVGTMPMIVNKPLPTDRLLYTIKPKHLTPRAEETAS
jgi:hypothetical protein